MKILVACEESQRVCISFRNKGHEAFSCDIQEPSGGFPEYHIHDNALSILGGGMIRTMNGDEHYINHWDMIIAHPPCTYLTNASSVRIRVKGVIQEERYRNAMKAKEFFLKFLNADCERICVENPVPMKLVDLPTYTQIIEPWQFGEPWKKKTCLWLRGLPKLNPTQIITYGIQPWVNGGSKDSNGNYRRFKGRNERDPKNRSKTFWGIAKAMAEQWG